MEGRRLRRMVGLLHARLPELDLGSTRGHGRSLAQILRATLVGLMAGCKGLWEAEQLTARLSVASRRQLGLAGSVTTTSTPGSSSRWGPEAGSPCCSGRGGSRSRC
jgi:hypothetical protein